MSQNLSSAAVVIGALRIESRCLGINLFILGSKLFLWLLMEFHIASLKIDLDIFILY